MRNLLPAVLALVMAPGCALDDIEPEVETGSDVLPLGCKSRTCLRYQDWENNGERLFLPGTRSPTAILVGTGEGSVVMFGYDGLGRAQFAYVAFAEELGDMVGAATREAAVSIGPNAGDGGAPWGGGFPGGPPSPPIGDDLVPVGVVRAVGIYSRELNQAQSNFFDLMSRLE